jgi:hypothetical protein
MIGRSNQAAQAGSIEKIVKRKQRARKARSTSPTRTFSSEYID